MSKPKNEPDPPSRKALRRGPAGARRAEADGRRQAKLLAELDEVVSALAHPSRRQILLVVRFRGGEMTAGEIAERFSCAWPTVSRHLKVLQEADLLAQERRGRTRVYRLNRTKLDVLKDWLRWLD